MPLSDSVTEMKLISSVEIGGSPELWSVQSPITLIQQNSLSEKREYPRRNYHKNALDALMILITRMPLWFMELRILTSYGRYCLLLRYFSYTRGLDWEARLSKNVCWPFNGHRTITTFIKAGYDAAMSSSTVLSVCSRALKSFTLTCPFSHSLVPRSIKRLAFSVSHCLNTLSEAPMTWENVRRHSQHYTNNLVRSSSAGHALKVLHESRRRWRLTR